MFKTYLRDRPKGFQLGIFIFLWAALYLITIILQSVVIRSAFHIGNDQLTEFASNSIAQHPVFVIVSNAVYSVLVFGLPAFFFAYLAHPAPISYLGLHRPENQKQWKWVVLLAIGLLPVITIIGGLLKEINLGEAAKQLQETRDAQFNAYLKGSTSLDLLRNIFFLALLPAFCEELFFRGVIQKFAFSYSKKGSIAILISALTFALMHMSIYEFLPIFLAGLALAWVYQQTGCLWLNVVVHMLFNGLQVFIAYYTAHDEAFSKAGENNLYLIIAAAIGLLLLYWSFHKLFQLRTPFGNGWSVEEPESEKEKYL